MTNESRPLRLFADSTEIADGCRIRIQGSTAMNLLPNCYCVHIHNIDLYDVPDLKVAKQIRAVGEDGTRLFSGELEDIYTHEEGTANITTVVVSDGKKFWESAVKKTLGAGTMVSRTARMLLDGIAPLRYNADDFRILRGQVYDGRLADAISMLAASVKARAYFVNGAVQFTAKGKASDLVFPETDEIYKEPGYAEGTMVLSAQAKGYAVGSVYRVAGGRYRLVKQTFNLDNWQGNWRTELTFLDETVISAEEMGGG